MNRETLTITQYKNIYDSLGRFKAAFKFDIMEAAGWGNTTFYNKINGVVALTHLEKQAFYVHADNYLFLNKKHDAHLY